MNGHAGSRWLMVGLLLAGCAPGDDAIPHQARLYRPAPVSSFGLDPARSLDQFARRQWRAAEGLPQNSVQDIVQTRDGYLWLATQEGLARFDGARFEVIDRSTLPILPHNDIASLWESPAGVLWAGLTQAGVVRVAGSDPIRIGRAEGLPATDVTALAGDGGEGLWIATRSGGLAHWDEGTRRVRRADGIPATHVTALVITADGTLLAGTAGGLFRGPASGGAPFERVRALGEQAITALAAAPHGTIWAATESSLIALSGGRTRTLGRVDGLPSDQVLSLHADRYGNVWAGTQSGLARIRSDGIAPLTPAQGFIEDRVIALYVDREGSLWAGTDFEGLLQVTHAVVANYSEEQGLPAPIVYVVAPSAGGGLWTGSHLGDIARFSGGRASPYLDHTRFGDTRLRTLLEASDGTLWIGCDNGLYRSRQGRVSRVQVVPGRPMPVRALLEEPDGTLWVGTDGAGLFRRSRERWSGLNTADGLGSDLVRDLMQAADGTLWVATYGGLSRWDGSAFQNYTTDDGLPSNTVRTLLQSRDGSIWAGTYGNGLAVLVEGRFVPITAENGLPTEVVFSLLEDLRGDIWMTGNRGIVRITRSSLDAVAAGRASRVDALVLDESDGMRERECNGGNPGAVLSANGRQVWVATVGGLAGVDIGRLVLATQPPGIVLRTVRLDGNEAADFSEGLAVPPRIRHTSYQYAAPTFVSPGSVRYRYRLEPYDTGWVDGRDETTIQYTRVPPGRYAFNVEATVDGETWSEPAVLPVRVVPFFYETPWFYVLGGLVILGGILGFVQIRVARAEHMQRVLTRRVDEAVAHVKTLKGMLPICAHCKKIRDDSGYWQQVEEYVHTHSDAEFSHGICPDCMKELYPDFVEPA